MGIQGFLRAGGGYTTTTREIDPSQLEEGHGLRFHGTCRDSYDEEGAVLCFTGPISERTIRDRAKREFDRLGSKAAP